MLRFGHVVVCTFLLTLSSAAGAEVRILTYGDSNTWGFKPTAEGDFLPRYTDAQRWSGVMQQSLGADYEVRVAGIPGRSLNYDLPGNIGSISKEDGNGMRRLALSLNEDAPVNLVIVMLGTNDLIHKPRPSPDQIALGLVKLKRLAEAGTVAYTASQKERLLFIVPAPLHDTRQGPFKDDFDAQSVKESRELARAFVSEGKRIGVPVFDAGSVVEAEGIDGIHLSESGHKRLGEAIAREVRTLVQP
jgi:lysophospholipase L1-like esterase